MKITFSAVAAFVLASAFLQTAGYAQTPSPGQPYIQVPIPQIPGFGAPPRGEQNYDRERWEHCENLRLTARIEHDWSTGFVRCITSASSATVAKIGRVFEPSSTRSIAPPAIAADAGGATEDGVSPAAKVLDLKGRLLCRGCGRQRRAAVRFKAVTSRAMLIIPASPSG